MTLARLMDRTVYLLRTTSTVRDAIGGTSVVQSSTASKAYLEPTRGTEDLANRNTGVGDWLLVLPADADVTNWDAVEYGTQRFEIVAPPRPMWNPRTHALSHYEVDLQEVQGTTVAAARSMAVTATTVVDIQAAKNGA